MNATQMMASARKGVTLVELLVVILIVTILSVSLLPLLKPFVVEAQYAAEAIPVIGNLRTKIGLYQYEKGNLPSKGDVTKIETWCYTTTGTTKFDPKTDTTGTAIPDTYLPATLTLQADAAPNTLAELTGPTANEHFGFKIDVDNQDLAGKRCRPVHYQYVVIRNGAQYIYVLGCFGDDNGLPAGTGYAVCEINVTGRTTKQVYKLVGTWKRYKAVTSDQLGFGTISGGTTDTKLKKNSAFCAVPAASYLDAAGTAAEGNGLLTLVKDLKDYGWEFN